MDLCEFLTLIGSYFRSGLQNSSCSIDYQQVKDFVIHLKFDITPYTFNVPYSMRCVHDLPRISYVWKYFQTAFHGKRDTLCKNNFLYVPYWMLFTLTTSFIEIFYKKDATMLMRLLFITHSLAHTIWSSSLENLSVIVKFVKTKTKRNKL